MRMGESGSFVWGLLHMAPIAKLLQPPVFASVSVLVTLLLAGLYSDLVEPRIRCTAALVSEQIRRRPRPEACGSLDVWPGDSLLCDPDFIWRQLLRREFPILRVRASTSNNSSSLCQQSPCRIPSVQWYQCGASCACQL